MLRHNHNGLNISIREQSFFLSQHFSLFFILLQVNLSHKYLSDKKTSLWKQKDGKLSFKKYSDPLFASSG